MYLDNAIKKYFTQTSPVFDQIMALLGERYRYQKGRLTQRIVLGGQAYFIKQYFGVGLREVIKNLLQLRLPVLSAKNEWHAIQKLQALGISVPAVMGFGVRGWNPIWQQSFVLMQELAPVISLEELGKQWQQHKPAFAVKQKLINEVAHIARVLHENGINHRDFYLCHFLLAMPNGKLPVKNEPIQLHLIDLHRAQIRRTTPLRWMIKDLAGLYFSSKEIGLTQRDLYRFIKSYSGKSLRDINISNNTVWQKVKMRGEQLYCNHNR